MKGVPTIRRAIINIKESNDDRGKKGDKELLVEGYGLQKVMTTQGMPMMFAVGSYAHFQQVSWENIQRPTISSRSHRCWE